MSSVRAKTVSGKNSSSDEAWKLGVEFGLVSDQGWVDALRDIYANATTESTKRWRELIALCRDAQPRIGQDWVTVEAEVESKCGYPPLEYPAEAPKPEPGSPEYQQSLEQAAPDENWMKQARAMIETADMQKVVAQLPRLICRAMQSGIGTLNRNSPNKAILRSLIWCAALSSQAQCVEALRQLAIWSVEHKTAQAKTIGIALAFTDSDIAAAALRMIAQAVKRPSPQTRFQRYASHVEAKIGVRSEDSAERFIPTFELDIAGVRRAECGVSGSVELRVTGSRAAVQIFNASGRSVRTPPAALKQDYAQLVDEFRNLARALNKLIAAQCSRIESFFLTQPNWNFSTWRERYLDHPVVGVVARRLIWLVDGQAVLFLDGRAFDEHEIFVEPRPNSRVQLWHPLGGDAAQIQAWRMRLESMQITQPFKQAHREVYLLTDAERQTASYSNRYAAHILHQSQFRALALARGWQRPFVGDWDGIDGKASRDFPGGWRVEFWVNGVGVEHGPTGGLLHISTDQIRFYFGGGAEPTPLESVPPLLFSEAMRDVDLFVGVASVGNDPTWSDGGPEGRYRDYWQNYSFGDLNASAKTRKDVLQRLVPKLKIASQCSFNEKFLVVKGSLRTYKIHLGSGNILMMPNDQYLCIVPKQGEAVDSPVLLPFEGDRTLSVIISKALLLADDAKIKDASIVNQIKGR